MDMEVDEVLGVIWDYRRTTVITEFDMDWISSDFSTESIEGANDVIVVLDTNVLLSQLSLLQSLHDLLVSLGSSKTKLLIPQIVIFELDALKTSASIGLRSREATRWILEKLKNPNSSVLIGQKKGETLLEGTKQKVDNDGLILDVCLYFQKKEKDRKILVFIFTNDHNLALRAKVEGILHLTTRRTNSKTPPSAISVLQQIDPTCKDSTPSPGIFRSPSLSPSPSMTRSRHAAEPFTIMPAPFPARSLSTRNDMELEIPLVPLLPPCFYPAQNTTQLFEQLSAILVFFLALPIYRFLLRGTGAIGDWREWDVDDCLKIIKLNWEAIKELAEQGLRKKALSPTEASVVPPSTTSKWSTKVVRKIQAPATNSIEKEVKDIYDSLTPLRASFAWAMRGERCSALKAEIILLQVRGVLAIYAGAMQGNISVEIQELVLNFVEEFRKLGIEIDLTDFT